MIYNDSLITYNGQLTDAAFSTLIAQQGEILTRLGSSASAPLVLDVASAVSSTLGATAIPVDVKKVNGQSISGVGSEADPWGPA